MATSSGYGAYQLNVKAGNDLLNIAADSAEQLRERIDALFGEDAASDILGKFVATSLLAPVVAYRATDTENATVTSVPAVVGQTVAGNGDAPTPKQIKFAQSLGIQNADSLDRRQLSAEIDKRTGGRKR
jgi:hypothetical protein